MRRRLAMPREVTIKGRRWRVRHMATRSKRGKFRGLAGYCEIETRTIDIDRRMPRDEQEKTYIHEVLHAMWPQNVVSDAIEERLILRLEGPLRALVLDGGLLMAPEEVP